MHEDARAGAAADPVPQQAHRPGPYRGIGGSTIDPTFERNPGIGRSEQLGDLFAAHLRTLATDTVPAGSEISKALKIDSGMSDRLAKPARRTIRVIERIHGTGNMPVLPVIEIPGQAQSGRFRTRRGRARDIALKANDHPELVLAHEIGHYLDRTGLPRGGYQSTKASMAAMQALLDAVMRTMTWRSIRRARDDAVHREAGAREVRLWNAMLKPQEAFARAYAHYVAWKSGDPRMLAQLDARMSPDQGPRMRLRQWPVEEWLPIAQAMDNLLAEVRWLKIEFPAGAQDRDR